MTALPSTIPTAPVGHHSTQLPQASHASGSITGIPVIILGWLFPAGLAGLQLFHFYYGASLVRAHTTFVGNLQHFPELTRRHHQDAVFFDFYGPFLLYLAQGPAYHVPDRTHHGRHLVLGQLPPRRRAVFHHGQVQQQPGPPPGA